MIKCRSLLLSATDAEVLCQLAKFRANTTPSSYCRFSPAPSLPTKTKGITRYALLPVPVKNMSLKHRKETIATGEAQVARVILPPRARAPRKKIQLETGGFIIHLFLKTDTGVNHLTGVKNTQKPRKRTAMAIF
jgi:hypothetical protein